MLELWKALIGDYIKQHAFVFLIYLILILFLFPLDTIIIPKIIGRLFGEIQNLSPTDSFAKFDFYKDINLLNTRGLIILLFSSWFLYIIGTYVKRCVESYFIPKYGEYIRSRIINSIINMAREHYTTINPSELLSRSFALSVDLKNSLNWLLSRAFPQLLSVFVIIGYLYYVDATLGNIMSVTMIIVFVISYFYSYIIMNKSQIREKQYIKMIRNTSDRFHNLMQVFINNQEGHMMESNEFDNDKYTIQFIKQSITETNFSVTAEIITLFGYFTSVLYIVNKSIQKKFSHKEIVPLILILGNLNTYILLNTSGIAHFLFARIGSLNESTDFLEALLFQQSSRQFDSVINKGRIQFKDVSFRYNDTTTNVINNVSFTVRPGEKVAIIGQSGSGKSTLMKMLVGLYKPTSGVIYVDGFNINKITHQHLRDKIVYINQHTVLFDDTVASNIQYGNNTSVAEIQQILKKYKLDTIYENLPNGIQTKAGVNGLNLSHGMQKVTIILRGLLKPSSVIILDEPLAGLDSNTRQKVLRLIMDYTENKTTVVITHDKEILPFMDHTITPTSQKKAIETSPFTNQLFE